MPRLVTCLLLVFALGAVALSAAASTAGTTGEAVWPLQPEPDVVRHFDPPAERWGRGHRGVDLAGSAGQQVRSALPGTVSFAGRLAGRGVVVVDHGGRRTTYEPVGAAVSVGQSVGAGTVIGTLEWFDSHCMPAACLHWGLIVGRDEYRDPLGLLRCVPRPVRLLPLDRPLPVDGPGCGAAPWGEVRSRTPVPPEESARVAAAAAHAVVTVVRLVGALAGRPSGGAPW